MQIYKRVLTRAFAVIRPARGATNAETFTLFIHSRIELRLVLGAVFTPFTLSHCCHAHFFVN